ncbi:MAG: Gfo/Idh/MocA family oxidoreductase, partial [Flavobacteriales bacterium]|nr:Gfo/Idh/MocA family oxidoreductase [Flavobacteriales bacterium]
MLKIGVLGAGHLGKIHLKCIGLLPETYELIGFYDPNEENAAAAQQATGVKAYNSIESLIKAVDVVDVVTPTLSHFDCAAQAIREQKHVFIEKPITNTLEEAKKLMKLAH